MTMAEDSFTPKYEITVGGKQIAEKSAGKRGYFKSGADVAPRAEKILFAGTVLARNLL